MKRRGFLTTLLLPFLPTPQLPWEDEEMVTPSVKVVFDPPITLPEGEYVLFLHPAELDGIKRDPAWVGVTTLDEFKAEFGDFS